MGGNTHSNIYISGNVNRNKETFKNYWKIRYIPCSAARKPCHIATSAIKALVFRMLSVQRQIHTKHFLIFPWILTTFYWVSRKHLRMNSISRSLNTLDSICNQSHIKSPRQIIRQPTVKCKLKREWPDL